MMNEIGTTMTLTRPFSRVDIVRMATLLPGPFTVEMYHKLGELGIFDEDDRVEEVPQRPGRVVEAGRAGERGLDDLEVVSGCEAVEAPGERQLRREGQGREPRQKRRRPVSGQVSTCHFASRRWQEQLVSFIRSAIREDLTPL